MQLPLGSDPHTDTLRRMQAALISHFGQMEPRPAERRDPVWALVQGVIGAQTKMAVSNANADALLARYGSWKHVAAASVEELADILSGATYPNVAAERLLVNTSIFNRRALVVDTHHRRVVQRMGLVPPKADTRRACDALMSVLPEEWSPEDVDEHHLLVKRVGQALCRPSHTDCPHCPLRDDCMTGKAHS